MPYIKIKCYPKDEQTKQKVVERINETFLELWGCPKEAISISLEEVEPANWDAVVKTEIEPNEDKMMVLAGEKRYE
ncbi:MAG: tautomerase family protein [Clostridia bacterium]|nr:tautomerase family protein [Clostridia bacterium]MBQ3554153.1 tautomerase family protein [Clostridia bacterium]